MISVCIPVGPFKGNKDWLDEAIDSCKNQTLKPEQILLINDGAGESLYDYIDVQRSDDPFKPHRFVRVWDAPWRLGISHAFNFGVMLAPTECVFMLGSDDTLESTCLERCWESYLKHNKEDAYYSVPIRYMDTQEVQTAPCNAAMVTKGFWRKTGGFPIETAIGIGDSTLLSICLAHKLPVYWVGHDTDQDDVSLYNYRRHPDIHTFKLGKWWGVIDQIRNICTENWQEPDWGHNYD